MQPLQRRRRRLCTRYARGGCDRKQSAHAYGRSSLLCDGRGHIICPGYAAGGSTASVGAAGGNGCAAGGSAAAAAVVVVAVKRLQRVSVAAEVTLVAAAIPLPATLLCSLHAYENLLDLSCICCSFGLQSFHIFIEGTLSHSVPAITVSNHHAPT